MRCHSSWRSWRQGHPLVSQRRWRPFMSQRKATLRGLWGQGNGGTPYICWALETCSLGSRWPTQESIRWVYGLLPDDMVSHVTMEQARCCAVCMFITHSDACIPGGDALKVFHGKVLRDLPIYISLFWGPTTQSCRFSVPYFVCTWQRLHLGKPLPLTLRTHTHTHVYMHVYTQKYPYELPPHILVLEGK